MFVETALSKTFLHEAASRCNCHSKSQRGATGKLSPDSKHSFSENAHAQTTTHASAFSPPILHLLLLLNVEESHAVTEALTITAKRYYSYYVSLPDILKTYVSCGTTKVKWPLRTRYPFRTWGPAWRIAHTGRHCKTEFATICNNVQQYHAKLLAIRTCCKLNTCFNIQTLLSKHNPYTVYAKNRTTHPC